MRRKGFSFACTLPRVRSKDEAFERFCKTAKADPSKIYNPWPQFACSDNFNQAQTQPLIRIEYVPTCQLDIYPSNSKQKVTVTHEFAHTNFDNTPAKVFARLILLNAYDLIRLLLEQEDWDKEAWQGLVQVNAHLSAICRAITLSEELMAIAHSFNIVPKFCSPKELVELERLEEISIEKYQRELSPNFAALYYETFKKVVEWSHDKPTLMEHLYLFLQGIQPNKYTREIEVVDSNERCMILAEKVMHLKNGAELEDWLIRTVQQDELISWIGCYRALADFSRTQGEDASSLWTLMEGKKPRRGACDAGQVVKRALKATRPNRVQVTLHAQESDRGWFIAPIIPYYNKGSRSQQEAAVNLIRIEALRQQLDEGKGIYCPWYKPGICMCWASWQDALWRILYWAREGKFGRGGDWRDLPSECSWWF